MCFQEIPQREEIRLCQIPDPDRSSRCRLGLSYTKIEIYKIKVSPLRKFRFLISGHVRAIDRDHWQYLLCKFYRRLCNIYLRSPFSAVVNAMSGLTPPRMFGLQTACDLCGVQGLIDPHRPQCNPTAMCRVMTVHVRFGLRQESARRVISRISWRFR